MYEATKAYRKTPKGVLTVLYSKMKERNAAKGFGALPFTLAELHERYLKAPAFLELFSAWENGGCKMNDKPSFDRLNPTLGYSLENIELKTWGENRKKADWEKTFIYTTPVVMYDRNGAKIREFGSTKEAVLATGITQSLITGCCQGKYKTAKGYIFKYRGDRFKFSKSNPELLEGGEGA